MTVSTTVTIFVWIIVVGVILTLLLTGVMTFSCGIPAVGVFFIILGIVIVIALMTSNVFEDDNNRYRLLAGNSETFFKEMGESKVKAMKEITELRFNFSKELIDDYMRDNKDNKATKNAKIGIYSVNDIVKKITYNGI